MTIDLAADNAIFVQDFAEAVSFRPTPEADSRQIEAVPNRDSIDDGPGSPFAGQRQATMHWMVRNDATDGITPSQITEDESELQVASRVGDTPRWRPIQRILRQNKGCLLLEVTV